MGDIRRSESFECWRSKILKKLLNNYTVRFFAWLFVYNFVDLAAKYLPGPQRPRDGRERLVIVKVDGIGDYVVWTSTFDALNAAFPPERYERVLIGSTRWRDIGEADETFERKDFVDPGKFATSLSYRYKKLREFRQWDADILLSPRITREFLWTDAIVRVIPSKLKVGSRGLRNLMIPIAQAVSDRWYDRLIDAPIETDHEAESNRKFLSAFLGAEQQLSRPIVPLQGGSALKPRGRYAIFFPGAMTDDKCWPADRFAETAKWVSRQYGLEIVICGGPDDGVVSRRFIEAFGGGSTDLTGKTTLPELAALIAEAELLVTNDTGAGHIAAATGTPAAIVTPGNFFGRYFPYPAEIAELGVRQRSAVHEMPCFGCGWKCVYQDLGGTEPKPCIAEISVSDLERTISDLMGATGIELEDASQKIYFDS